MATWLVIGETTYIGDIPAGDLAIVYFELPGAVAQLTVETSSTAWMYVDFPGPGSYEGPSPCVRSDVPAGEGFIEIYGGAGGQTNAWVRVSTGAVAPEDPDPPGEPACFWAPESVIGLSKVCTAAAPVGDVLSFTPQVNGSGEYVDSDGSGYGLFELRQRTPYFDTALENAVFVGTITGISFIREKDGSGPDSLGGLGDPMPGGVVFDPVAWDFPINDGSAYEGTLGAFAAAGQSNKYYYGRVEVGGQTFYGLFAVGSGI